MEGFIFDSNGKIHLPLDQKESVKNIVNKIHPLLQNLNSYQFKELVEELSFIFNSSPIQLSESPPNS